MNYIKKLIPNFILGWYYQLWPFAGAVIYRFPGKKLKVIGVTGTNGKTTIVHLATEVLEAAVYRVASISSLRFKIGEREWKNELKMTMPGRTKIQKFLRQAVDAGCQYVVMEVTSEGIKQYRHKFIDFDVAVFTNLTPEHLERHGGFENYKKAKGELFKRARACIINLDDENAEYFANLCSGKKYGYSVNENLKMKNEKLQSKVEKLTEAKNIDLKPTLMGEFNLYNALAAACIGLSQEINERIIKRAIENFKGVPGRMEVVINEPFGVIVDYAHTPDALEKVYKTIKEVYKLSPYGGSPAGRQTTNYKLVCVLGAAGGGRDKWKRPQMGKIAAHYCDEIVLTNEDPYDENPQKIISQVEAGVRSEDPCSICVGPDQSHDSQRTKKEILRILDRREAIKKALEDARRGDAVIITGKGAEPWMMTSAGKIPWDDRNVVKEVIGSLHR